jgi:hypothetical protein
MFNSFNGFLRTYQDKTKKEQKKTSGRTGLTDILDWLLKKLSWNLSTYSYYYGITGYGVSSPRIQN